MGKTRAIRLSDEESNQIEEFLNLNPFLDFSNLARTAIMQFIRDPQVQIKPIPSGTSTGMPYGQNDGERP